MFPIRSRKLEITRMPIVTRVVSVQYKVNASRPIPLMLKTFSINILQRQGRENINPVAIGIKEFLKACGAYRAFGKPLANAVLI
jgi:hypothetical protein